jgi:hypothetical protein
MSAARLLALTEQIYDAAAGGTSWDSVGHGLAALVHARSASIMAGDLSRGAVELLSHANIPQEAVAAYGARYRHVDLWTARAARHAAVAEARITTSGQLVPEEEFLRSEFWNEFGRRYGPALRPRHGGAARARRGDAGRPAPPARRAALRGGGEAAARRPCCRISAARCSCATGWRRPRPRRRAGARAGGARRALDRDRGAGCGARRDAGECRGGGAGQAGAGFRLAQTHGAAGRRTGFEPLRREERDALLALVAARRCGARRGARCGFRPGRGGPPWRRWSRRCRRGLPRLR